MKERRVLKRGRFILAFLLGIIFFLMPFVFGDTPTEVTVPNSPPYLVMDIPNQSWEENQTLSNSFDLDDYFADNEGDPLSYYNSSVMNIYVSINSITNEVSFFPDAGFSGTRQVVFYASDSVYDTLSNTVYLFVGLDNTPPQWNSPAKDKAPVYQNDVVAFSANWTDDKGLEKYIFSINQGAGWVNYSTQYFSGLQNLSLYSLQIKTPAYGVVYWRFYAFDTSNNVNATDIQNFTIASQVIPPEGGGGDEGEGSGGGAGGAGGIDILKQRKTEDFRLSVSSFKVSLKQGSFKTFVLKITNTGLEEIPISLSAEKVSEFTVFSDQNVSILPGQSTEITIDFSASERAIPGQYFGHIIVRSPNIERQLPVILDIHALNLDFDLKVNLSEGYDVVKPGKNVKIGVEIFSLEDIKERNVSMYYAIKDYEGKVYNFSEENIILISSLFFEKEILIPETTPEGEYLVYTRATNNNTIAIGSVFFEVGTRFNFFSFLKISTLVFLIILFAILLAIFMARYIRDKKKERLLELYLMLNKLKTLIKQKKENEALELFIRIKKVYHEPIPKEIFDDKEKLKRAISELYTNFAKDSKEMVKSKEIPPVNNPLPQKEKSESKKEDQKKIQSEEKKVAQVPSQKISNINFPKKEISKEPPTKKPGQAKQFQAVPKKEISKPNISNSNKSLEENKKILKEPLPAKKEENVEK